MLSLGAPYQIPAKLGRGGGSLIFTSSCVGHSRLACRAPRPSGCKVAGVIGLVKTVAVELGPKAIRVNAILPGGTDTAAAQAFADTEDKQALSWGACAPSSALQRRTSIALTVLYLASDASTFTTGTALLVDGGVSINKT